MPKVKKLKQPQPSLQPQQQQQAKRLPIYHNHHMLPAEEEVIGEDHDGGSGPPALVPEVPMQVKMVMIFITF